MFRTLTSLSFLYAFVIAILLLYGRIYYLQFIRSKPPKKRFSIVFLLIALACLSFLWINMHAPLSLKSYSNLDHHFIRHDGYSVTGSLELGNSDTLNLNGAPFNRFGFSRSKEGVKISSPYSDEPFYVQESGAYKIASKTYPAIGHGLDFTFNKQRVTVSIPSDEQAVLKIGEQSFTKKFIVKKGSSLWNLFRDEDEFIRSEFYNDPALNNALKNAYLLRDNVARRNAGELKFFVSGRLPKAGYTVKYDQQILSLEALSWVHTLPDESRIAWGIGFLDNNRNQYRIQYAGADTFMLSNVYPVAYPLTEENQNDWSEHAVSKFLVADGKDITGMPDMFKEGFLFPSYSESPATKFAPILLGYQKSNSGNPPEISARLLQRPSALIPVRNSKLFLPTREAGVSWMFSFPDSSDWQFGNTTFSSSQWTGILFGSLGLYVLLVLISSLIQPASKQSWVWQLISSITLVLLCTRYLLYWRYKTFPPYEGMDLPSQQQLQSFSNFGIIVFATVVLALIFGFPALKFIYQYFSRTSGKLIGTKKPYLSVVNAEVPFSEKLKRRFPFLKKLSARTWFFASWLFLLILSGGFAAINHFDPGVCRHIAIAFILLYFFYLYLSYKYSPLVSSAGSSWWTLGTGRTLDIIASNPVKILLSVSLLGLFVFIDIGFAIVFLNFLLFNEAFLCINYAAAGLSAGSKRNSILFGALGMGYMAAFVLNLIYAPYIFKWLLELPQLLYLVGYIAFSVSLAYVITRLLYAVPRRKLIGAGTAIVIFAIAFLFFPKERILEKAAMTKYRIDVLSMPVDEAITGAYKEGKTYEPVIRAAQNQWFINTFIYEENNPAVYSTGFKLLQHAPQNKGAKYNAQATDLVASRFLIGEHGMWAVLLYVLLLVLPAAMLASFYKLYPDFTNRINEDYPRVTAGFSILNYLLITALLVILAATGRYIFFGQDLPFGSILSKQSILFPCLLILAAVLCFRQLPLEYYANRRKLLPGMVVFVLLALLLFVFRPQYNRNKEFGVAGLANNMDNYIQENVQPLFDHFDTSARTHRLSFLKKDQLFTDSLRKLLDAGFFVNADKFFSAEMIAYSRASFSRHLDQRRLLYLDISNGSPRLEVNDNYFRVEAPPHIQQLWTGNVFGNEDIIHLNTWNASSGTIKSVDVSTTRNAQYSINSSLILSVQGPRNHEVEAAYHLVNKGSNEIEIRRDAVVSRIAPNDSLGINNPSRISFADPDTKKEQVITLQPDAFMKNYYVNGSRFYVYPMSERFNWARNFSESVASDYTSQKDRNSNLKLSLDFGLMDSLTLKMRDRLSHDTAYKPGAEYAVCVADGNGGIVAMADFIKGIKRPDPNDKPAFNNVLDGENGVVSQSLLRKQIGNINLLRMNPGPGSTLKPIVFAAIASQLNLEWDAFQSEGFSVKQHSYGGSKVAEYDFEKDNGVISTVNDYIKYSDNYYHSNVLLLGSYPKQGLPELLTDKFSTTSSGNGFQWPYFNYKGRRFWLNNFNKWPGFESGKATFGSDSSFTSIGLNINFNIYTRQPAKNFDLLHTRFDSTVFEKAGRKSGFILPENALFDQQGEGVDHRIPYDLFTSSFRGHVKGSSQVRIPPARMVEAIGKLTSQNRNYSLTLDPNAGSTVFQPFYVDGNIPYNTYLSLMRENVFAGMREALLTGTAARLGSMLKNGSPYYYYGKTGTTGDDELKTKSKLFVIVISQKDLTDPDYNFRNNRFYTIYFTSQNGPASQNEAFQAEIIRYIESSEGFNNYMKGIK